MIKLPSIAELLKQQEEQTRCYSTGSLWLDLAIEQQDPITGLFGVPSRTILEAYGYQRTGKTLLGEALALSVLKTDPKNEVIFLLAEEPNYKRMIAKGLDPERTKAWTFKQDEVDLKKNPESFLTAENGMNIILNEIRTNRNVKMVMIDSVSSLVSNADVRSDKSIKEMDDKEMPAIRARLMKRFLLSWLTMNNSNAILFMTNHYNDPLPPGPGHYPPIGSGFKPNTPGGKFMEYSSYLRIRCDSSKIENDEVNPITGVKDMRGMELYYTVISNKFGTSTLNRRASTTFIFEDGKYKKTKEIAALATGLEIIPVAGSWYVLGKDKDGTDIKVQGLEQVETYLEENPKIALDLEKRIIAQREKIFKSAGKAAKPKLRAKTELK